MTPLGNRNIRFRCHGVMVRCDLCDDEDAVLHCDDCNYNFCNLVCARPRALRLPPARSVVLTRLHPLLAVWCVCVCVCVCVLQRSVQLRCTKMQAARTMPRTSSRTGLLLPPVTQRRCRTPRHRRSPTLLNHGLVGTEIGVRSRKWHALQHNPRHPSRPS